MKKIIEKGYIPSDFRINRQMITGRRGRVVERDGEPDQFQLIEERVDSLIRFIEAYKKEKESLIEKIRLQEGKIADLTSDMELLEGARDRAKQIVSSLLAKIEQLKL